MKKEIKQTPNYKIENLFLIFAVVFGLLTALIQPIFSPPDEYTHFKYAYNIFHKETENIMNEGEALAKLSPVDEDPARKAQVPADSGLTLPGGDFTFQEIYRNGEFLQKFFKDTPSSLGKLSVNIGFNDFKWLPQAFGVLLGSFIHPSLGIMTLVGRLFNLILYILVIYLAIKKAKFGQWVMAAVALLPVSIQQASSLSYDVLYYIAIFVAFSLLTNLWTRKRQLDLRWVIYIFLVFLLFLVPKAGTLALGLFFVTLPIELFGKNKFSDFLSKFWSFCAKHKWLTSLVVVFIFLAYFAYQMRVGGGFIVGLQAMLNTFFRPDLYAHLDDVLVSGIIGNFGQMTYRLPEWLIIIDFIFLFALMFNEKEEKLELRSAISGAIIYFAIVLVTAVTMLLNWTHIVLHLPNALVSLGNQGRYYTPFLIVLVPFCIYLKKYIKLQIDEKVIKKIFKWTISFNLVYFIVFTLVYYYTKDMGANLLPNLLQWIRNVI